MVADGALAQLARAPALQAGGPGFESLTAPPAAHFTTATLWGESGESPFSLHHVGIHFGLQSCFAIK